MRRVWVIGICVLVVSPAAPAAVTKTTVIRLKSITVKSSFIDKSPKGLSRGDLIHARFRLLNVVPQFGREVGAAVGSERSTYTFLSPTRVTLGGTVALPGGSIRYRGARGRLVVGTGKSPLNTYYLTLP